MKFDFQDLIDRKLVTRKRYDNGLNVFKYSKRVFFDALWNEDSRLLDARGIVLDDEGNAVIWPFTKVFNHLENGAGVELPLETRVQAVRKVNGFMAACRVYNGELIVSTTGSLDSDFAVLARKHIEGLRVENLLPQYTYIFEVCDESDPHIVEEELGIYLIGMRHMESGNMVQEDFLRHRAWEIGALRPEHFNCTLRELAEKIVEVQHEGFMVIDLLTYKTLFKWKSPHYLTKKFLMRMGQAKVDMMFDNKKEFLKTIDEEYYRVVHYITRWYDKESWMLKSDQQRRHIIEEYFYKIEHDAKEVPQ